MNRIIRTLVCCGLLVLAGASEAVADAEDEIQAAIGAFKAAFDAADAEGVAALYTEDAVSHSPGWRPVSGREAIATMYTAFFDAGFGNLTWETQSIAELGDGAAVEVRHDWTQRTDGDGTVTDHAFKVIAVWRRGGDGRWRISHDSFNDLPGG